MTDAPTEQLITQMPLEQQVANMKAHAGQIREAVKAEFGRAVQAGTLTEYRIALERVRGWQDSLEEYVAFAVSLKGGLGRAAADAKESYDTAWAQEASRNSHASVRRGEDFEGPRERYAKFDVSVFGPLRNWRLSEQRAALVSELLDEIWLRYRAVNATRDDIHGILRAYAFETSLDRGA